MEDLTNIWTIDDELNEEQLLNYLQGNTSADEAHLVEKQMADDAFVNDAIEGLQAIKSPKKLDEYVSQLNKKLQQQLDAKKQKKEKREIKHMGWIILAVIIILVLCVLGYVVIHMLHENEARKHATGILQVITERI
jgi:hypothetical protein